MATAQELLMKKIMDKKQAMKKTEATVKLITGMNNVRLLPGWRSIDPKTGDEIEGGDATFYHDYGQHFIKDAAGVLKAVYLCTHQTFDKDCEICGALVGASKVASDDATIKAVKDGSSKKSYLLNVLMLDSKEPNTPVILEVGYGIFNKILNILAEEDASPLRIEDGHIIKMTREGTGLTTKYDAQFSSKKSTVSKATLMKLHNLDDYVKQESDERKRLAVAAASGLVGYTAAPVASSVSSAPRLSGPPESMEDVMPDYAPASQSVEKEIAMDTELDDLLADL
jgi:hypothetical protein